MSEQLNDLRLVLVERREIGPASRMSEFDAVRKAHHRGTSRVSVQSADLEAHMTCSAVEGSSSDAVGNERWRFASEFGSVSASNAQIAIAGDFFGRSGLYWRRLGEGSVVIGTDLGAIAAFCGPIELDLEAIVDGMLFGAPAGETTYLTGVQRLAGPRSRIDVRANGRTSISIAIEDTDRAVADLKDLSPQSFAVRVRAGSDGTAERSLLLSGGLDSALIAASLVDGDGGSKLTALTFGTPDSVDVLRARDVARSLGIRHEIVDPSATEATRHLAESVVASQRPVGSPVLPAVMRRARQLSTVAVTGEGADQVFGGSWFLRRAELYRRELVRRWGRLERLLTPEAAARKSRVIANIASGPLDQRMRRLWEFETHRLTAARCVSVMGGHASAAGLQAAFPYLDEAFLAFVGAEPSARLSPFGWKPWLRRIAPDVLPPTVSIRVLETPKTPPGQGLAQLLQEVDGQIAAAQPPRWFDDHPVRRLALKVGEPFGAYQCAVYDTFVAHFLTHVDMRDAGSVHEMYADRETLHAVRERYSSIDRARAAIRDA
jgi:hypothetical protein